MTTEGKYIHEIQIVNGPRQYAFDKQARANGEPVTFTLRLRFAELQFETRIKTSDVPFERMLILFGHLKDNKHFDELLHYMGLKNNDSINWSIYFTARYDIQTGKGMMYPFLLNKEEVKLAHNNIELQPANHPYNYDAHVELPLEQKLIIDHQKELAFKRKLGIASINGRSAREEPEKDDASSRIAELKGKILQSSKGDKLTKQMLCWLLDETKLFTTSAGVIFPQSSAYDFGTSMLNNAGDILNDSSDRSLLSPYDFDVNLRNGTLAIADFSNDPDLEIKYHEVNMDLLNRLSKVRF